MRIVSKETEAFYVFVKDRFIFRNTVKFSECRLFSEDGQLSNKEFVAVMKNRLLRGLEKPKDTGFVKFVQSVIKCGSEELFSFAVK